MSWQAAIDAPGGGVRLTRSSQYDNGTVKQSPASLVAAASKVAGTVTLTEYTLARIVASEHYRGSAEELACIGDADLNRARDDGKTLFDHAAPKGVYGSQGRGGRLQATSRDPSVRHLRVARALLAGPSLLRPWDSVRGISRGARRYFDARVMNAKWNEGSSRHCSALAILDRWTFNKQFTTRPQDSKGRYICNLGPARSGGEEWVGPIAGVNAYELMLMRPAGPLQKAQYALAKKIIESKGKWHPPALGDAPMLAALLLFGHVLQVLV